MANEKPTTTKVKFLKPAPGYAYHDGETGELPADKATKLIADGYCQADTSKDETR